MQSYANWMKKDSEMEWSGYSEILSLEEIEMKKDLGEWIEMEPKM